MRTLYNRVLEAATLSDGEAAEPTGALDLSLERSSSGEVDGYVAFATPVQVDLTATGSAWFHVPAFMRWVAWRLSGSLSASAVVTLDIVAKP